MKAVLIPTDAPAEVIGFLRLKNISGIAVTVAEDKIVMSMNAATAQAAIDMAQTLVEHADELLRASTVAGITVGNTDAIKSMRDGLEKMRQGAVEALNAEISR